VINLGAPGAVSYPLKWLFAIPVEKGFKNLGEKRKSHYERLYAVDVLSLLPSQVYLFCKN